MYVFSSDFTQDEEDQSESFSTSIPELASDSFNQSEASKSSLLSQRRPHQSASSVTSTSRPLSLTEEPRGLGEDFAVDKPSVLVEPVAHRTYASLREPLREMMKTLQL